MTLLRLTAAQLAQLRAGAGDRATVEVLRTGQLGKHLLLLHQVVRAAARLDTATAGLARGWFAGIVRAEETDPAAVRDVLSYPTVGIWAAGCLAALRSAGRDSAPPGGPAALSHLGDIALACAIAAGLVRDGDARLALAGLGAGTPVRRVRVDAGGLVLDVVLDDVDPSRDLLGLGVIGRLGEDEVERWGRSLAGAWKLLVDTVPGHAEGMAAGLRCVVPLRSGPDANGVSATSEHGFGGVAISAGDPVSLAVGLLHEFQHSKLNALHYLADLWTDGPGRHYSPWRDDPRPVGGVLHGAYAYLAVVDFWRRRDGALAAFEHLRWREAVDRTLAALLRSGQLTALGERLAAGMRTHLATCPTEPPAPCPSATSPTGPAEPSEPSEPWSAEVERIRRWARLAVAEHRLAWRLRNVCVDDAAVERLAGDFTAGRAPSPCTVATVIRPAPWRPTASRCRRLDLMHRLLTGAPDAGPDAEPDAGDLALLDGRADDAATWYRKRMPDDGAARVGWLLVAGHPAPELLAALWHRLPDADPGALHGWSATLATDLPHW